MLIHRSIEKHTEILTLGVQGISAMNKIIHKSSDISSSWRQTALAGLLLLQLLYVYRGYDLGPQCPMSIEQQ